FTPAGAPTLLGTVKWTSRGGRVSPTSFAWSDGDGSISPPHLQYDAARSKSSAGSFPGTAAGLVMNVGSSSTVLQQACASTKGLHSLSFGGTSSFSLSTLGYGQLSQWGQSPPSTVETPTVVGGSRGFRKVATGFWSSCAIALDAGLWCWGYNDYGELGVGDT